MKSPTKRHKLNEYERYLISGLAHGAPVGKLPEILRHYEVEAHSMSSVEKNLQSLRKKCGCRTNTHLVYLFRNQVIKMNIDRLLD